MYIHLHVRIYMYMYITLYNVYKIACTCVSPSNSHTVNHEYQLVVQQLQSLQQVNEAICRVLTSQVSGLVLHIYIRCVYIYTCTCTHTCTCMVQCSLELNTHNNSSDTYIIHVCRIQSLNELVGAANQSTEQS